MCTSRCKCISIQLCVCVCVFVHVHIERRSVVFLLQIGQIVVFHFGERPLSNTRVVLDDKRQILCAIESYRRRRCQLNLPVCRGSIEWKLFILRKRRRRILDEKRRNVIFPTNTFYLYYFLFIYLPFPPRNITTRISFPYSSVLNLFLFFFLSFFLFLSSIVPVTRQRSLVSAGESIISGVTIELTELEQSQFCFVFRRSKFSTIDRSTSLESFLCVCQTGTTISFFPLFLSFFVDYSSNRDEPSSRNMSHFFQLPQIEQDGSDNGRRFRVENGDSPGEKEEVRAIDFSSLSHSLSISLSFSFCHRIFHFSLQEKIIHIAHIYDPIVLLCCTDVRISEYTDIGKSRVPNALVL